MAWLTGWDKRKSHIITGSTGGAQTDYPVKITAHYGSGSDIGDDVYLNSNSQTDFSDIRFTSSDGETDLPFWIESKTDSDNAVVWIKLPSIPASPSTISIYIYYGNAETGTNFTIGVMTDPHYDNTDVGAQERSEGINYTDDFVGWCNATLNPDLVGTCGDTIYPDTTIEGQTNLSDWEDAYDGISGADLLITPGNHDFDQLTLAQFLAELTDYTYWESGKAYGSFDSGGHHIIVLDACYASTTPYAHDNATKGYIPDGTDGSHDEQGWLTTDLAGTSLPTIVFCHHGLGEWNQIGNPYFEGTPANAYVDNRVAVRQILEDSGKVILVVCGHGHWTNWSNVVGIPYVTVNALTDTSSRESSNDQGTWVSVVINDWTKTVKIEVFEDDSGAGVQKKAEHLMHYIFDDANKKASNPNETFSMDYTSSHSKEHPSYCGGEQGQWYTNAPDDGDTKFEREAIGGPYRKDVQGLHLEGDSGGDTGSIGHPMASQSGKFKSTVNIRVSQSDGRVSFYWNDGGVGDSGPNDNYGTSNTGPYLDFSDSGLLIRYYDGSWHTLQSYVVDTWYELEVWLDVVNHTFTIDINGVNKATDVSFWSTSVASLDALVLRRTGATVIEAFLDDVRIAKYVDPEPAHTSWGSEESESVGNPWYYYAQQ